MSSRARRNPEAARDILYRCCAGLDVHQKTVVAGVRRVEATGQARQQVRTCGTMTGPLLALSHGLTEQGVQRVARESLSARLMRRE
jgi:transposase